MVSIAQETKYSGNETSRSYDVAAIRRFPLEEQRRIREDKVATWQRIRAQPKQNAETVAVLVGIPSRTLYYWQKNPIPKSTRPHNVRTRQNRKLYDERKAEVLKLRKKFQSWGAKKLHKYMENLNIDISFEKVCRMISELNSEKKIKSHYSGTFAKERTSNTGKAPRVQATPRPVELTSNALGEVVQVDTMYVRTGPKRFLYHVNATCIYSKLSYVNILEAHTAKNSAYLLK